MREGIDERGSQAEAWELANTDTHHGISYREEPPCTIIQSIDTRRRKYCFSSL